MHDTHSLPSLLWPERPQRSSGTPPWYDDLALEPIAQALSLHGRYTGLVRNILTALCSEPATIRFRQQIFADLLRLPGLAAELTDVLPMLAAASASGVGRWASEQGVFQIAQHISDLEAYVAAVRALLTALTNAQDSLQAPGLVALHSALNDLVSAAFFQNLERELPALRAQLDQAGSVTLGINLDAQLRPESATLLQISSGRFGGPRSLLGRLLGAERAQDHGRTPLRQAGERQTFGPDRQLFLDLNQLLQEVVAPLAATLTRFSRSEGASLAALEGEIAFYLGATRLASTLREAGYELCEPGIFPPEQRLFAAEGLYNLELALRLRAAASNGTAGPGSVVANDITFDDEGRIFFADRSQPRGENHLHPRCRHRAGAWAGRVARARPQRSIQPC
jgi:DNA mismatch repair protein MutS